MSAPTAGLSATLTPPRTWRLQERARMLAWGAWVAAIVFVSVALFFILATWSVEIPERGFGFRGWVPLVAVLWATIGARIASRQPRNAVGWLILACGCIWAITTMFEEYATFAYFPDEVPLPFVPWLVWFDGLSPSLVAGCSAFALLLIPDGKLPSRAWTPVGLVLGVVSLAATAAYAVVPRRLVPFPFDNPLGLDALRAYAAVLPSVMDGVYVLRGAAVLVPTAALFVRLRGATGERRQQLAWVAAAGALASVAFFLNAVIRGNAWIQLAEIATLVLVPGAFAVAMRRYRLYEIDRILNDAIVYGGATGLVAGAYVALIGVVQWLFVAMTGGRSDAAVIVLTLVGAAAFTPLKDRLQVLVDRVFTPHALPGTEGLAEFRRQLAAQLRMTDRIDLLTQLLDEAVVSLGAVGGGFRLTDEAAPRVTRRVAQWDGRVELSATVRDRDGVAAQLFLGPRINGQPYVAKHRAELRDAVDLVGVALDRLC